MQFSKEKFFRGLRNLYDFGGLSCLAFFSGGTNALYGLFAILTTLRIIYSSKIKEIAVSGLGLEPLNKDSIHNHLLVAEGIDLHKIVEEIVSHPKIACSKPDIILIKTDSINAFATGPYSGHALVGITTGLLNHVNEYAKKTKYSAEELVKATLLHEIGHISHNDFAISQAIYTLASLISTLFYSAYYKAIYESESSVSTQVENKERNNLYSTLLVPPVIILGSTIVQLLKSWISRMRETQADKTAFECGYGPQLVAALQIAEYCSDGICKPNPSSKDSFLGEDSFVNQLNNPEEKKKKKGIITWAFEAFSSHPAIDDRIEHLAALEKEKNRRHAPV